MDLDDADDNIWDEPIDGGDDEEAVVLDEDGEVVAPKKKTRASKTEPDEEGGRTGTRDEVDDAESSDSSDDGDDVANGGDDIDEGDEEGDAVDKEKEKEFIESGEFMEETYSDYTIRYDVIPENERITSDLITPEETTLIICARISQINKREPYFVPPIMGEDVSRTAQREFDARKCPLLIRKIVASTIDHELRTIKRHVEIWNPNEMKR
jgi:hypothetical protein